MTEAAPGAVYRCSHHFRVRNLRNKGSFKAIEIALEVYENRQRKVQTSKLNDDRCKAIEALPAPVVRGTAIKIKYVTQLPTQTPSFAFFANLPDDIKTPYRNYLENKLRENFNFQAFRCGFSFERSKFLLLNKNIFCITRNFE